jgi:hypothetical protein
LLVVVHTISMVMRSPLLCAAFKSG